MNTKITSAEYKPIRFITFSLTGGTIRRASSEMDLQFTSATIYGYKQVGRSPTYTPLANAGPVQVGWTDHDNVFGGGSGMPVFVDTILPGKFLELRPEPGSRYNFRDLWFSGATGDFVAIAFRQ